MVERSTGRRHKTREVHDKRNPVHVTMRVVREVGSLRASRPFAVVREALRKAQKVEFRIVEFSVQGNHLHLIVEADDRIALARGMQGLSIRIARGINKLLHRSGNVFTDRYHPHELKSPRELRNALAYVLQNFRRHAYQRQQFCRRGWMDECSSARWFQGWRNSGRAPEERGDDAPVADPETWLMREGWRRHGLVSVDEIPGYRG